MRDTTTLPPKTEPERHTYLRPWGEEKATQGWGRWLWLGLLWVGLGAAACQPAPSNTPDGGGTDEAAQDKRCAGREGFCSLRFDQMIFVMAHNAMSNSAEGWQLPLQNWTITRQLQEGVRGLMLDTYKKDDGTLVLCHGVCELGEKNLQDGLQEIKDFLDASPRAIVTIEFQDAAPAKETVDVFRTIGLDAYAHTQDPQQPWPTLGEMIERGHRLVVLADSKGGTVPDAPWYHKTWELAWDNPYAAKKLEDFRCNVGRGDGAHALFIMNHFLTAPFGLPELAEQANTQSSIETHLEQCRTEHKRIPNFIAVDFVDIGDVFKVVQTLRQQLLP